MVSIGSDGGFGRPTSEGGPVVDRVVFWSVGVGANHRFDRFRLELWFWRSNRLDSKNPGLGSRNPQKVGSSRGVGVGCRLRRVIRFYRTLTTVWTCEAKKPRWSKK